MTGIGVCHCFEGYVGDGCNACGAGFTASNDRSGRLSLCVFLAGVLSTCNNGVRDGLELGIDCGGVCLACNGTATNNLPGAGTSRQGMFLVAVVSTSVVGALVIAVVAGVVLTARRRAAARSKPPTGNSRSPNQAGGKARSLQQCAVYPVAVDQPSHRAVTGGTTADRVSAIALAGRSRTSGAIGSSRGNGESCVAGGTAGGRGYESRGTSSPLSGPLAGAIGASARVAAVSGGFGTPRSNHRDDHRDTPTPTSRMSKDAHELPASRVVPWSAMSARVVKVQPAGANSGLNGSQSPIL